MTLHFFEKKVVDFFTVARSSCRALVGSPEMYAADGGLQARRCTGKEREVKWDDGCRYCATLVRYHRFVVLLQHGILSLEFFFSLLLTFDLWQAQQMRQVIMQKEIMEMSLRSLRRI